MTPKAIADARRGTACAASSLRGSVVRDGRENERPATVEIARLSHEAGVDDDADAGNGDRRLGDIGGEDHLAPRGVVERPPLLVEREAAVERNDRERASLEDAPAGLDLRFSRQKDQDVAGIGGRPENRGAHARGQLGGIGKRIAAPEVSEVDGERAALRGEVHASDVLARRDRRRASPT